jgi:hypothetical protein
MDCRAQASGSDAVLETTMRDNDEGVDACLQTPADLLSFCKRQSLSPGAREMVMAKGQMRSNKEKKKPKADKNLKKGGAAPSPFASGKTPAGQSPNSKKN